MGELGKPEIGTSVTEEGELYRGQLPNTAMSEHNRRQEAKAEKKLAGTTNMQPRSSEESDKPSEEMHSNSVDEMEFANPIDMEAQ